MGSVRTAVGCIAFIVALLVPRMGAAQAFVATIPNVAGSISIHPVTHRAWFAEAGQDRVTVVDGVSVVQRIAAPATPTSVTFDRGLNRAYMPVLDSNYSLAVIDGNSNNAVRLIYAAQIGGIVVNERTHRVYGRSARVAGQVVVYDASDNRSTIDLPFGVCALAINDVTNQLYATHCNSDFVGASVADLDSGAVTTAPFPGATSTGSIVVNTVTNRAYVASKGGTTALLVIDGATKASRVVRVLDSSPSPPSLAVNAANNRIYAAWGTRVVTLDGATETLVAITNTSADVSNLRVDGATDKVYGLAGTVRLVGMDANGRVVSSLGLPFAAWSMDLDAATQRIYISGNGAGLIDAAASPPPSRPNYQGMWWNSPAGSESGWGVDIAQQGDILFAAWFTYDENGEPTWFTMSRGERISGETFSGTLYRTVGPDYTLPSFDPSRVSTLPVGTMSFTFTDAGNGTMEALVNGNRVIKRITRQVFALPVPTCEASSFPGAENFTDLFWNPSEAGWGAFLTHQGDYVFTVWFTYQGGKPTWFVGSNILKVASQSGGSTNTYSGALYRTSGPPYNAVWNPSLMRTVPVGNATLQFDYDTARFYWTAGGASRQPVIQRQVFSTPRTYCHTAP